MFILIKEIWATETIPRKIVAAIEYKKALSRKFRQSRPSSEVPDSNWIGSASYVIFEKPFCSRFSIWNLTHVLCLNASTFKWMNLILQFVSIYESYSQIYSTIFPILLPSISTTRFLIISAFSFIDSSIWSFTPKFNIENLVSKTSVINQCRWDHSKVDLLIDYSMLIFGCFSKLLLDL